MANVDVNFDWKKIMQIESEMLIALEQTADQMLTDVILEQKMPFDTGTMQNGQTEVDASKIAKTKEVRIVTSAPQARRLYYHPEYNFQKGKNPNAGGLWWDDYINGSKRKFVLETFKKLAERRLSR